ncbi:acetyl-CoA hydrolase/transferase C-terminal domain-containing protein [Arthrobacter sp. MA-N2]|uniref:acetyl-CoA hydrolase/transferase C-terminal domain-containing protein n=1 Tax=Arthrobacter sp. MA-N2 TaxID=1101188 RepID=UPI0004B74762|nr:acetyl-CoA hydrolase/transferase C-terminal domain-containing protein [Arthrobacter sp. MA-N2]
MIITDGLTDGGRSDSAAQRAAAELLAGRTRVTIMAAMSPQQPTTSIAALLSEARRRDISVRLLVADLSGAFAFLDAESENDLKTGSLEIVVIAGSAPRRLADLVDCLPISLWDADRLLGSGKLPCDIYAVRVAGIASGMLDLGNMVAFTPGLARRPGVRMLVEVSTGNEYDSGRSTLPLEGMDCVIWHDLTPVKRSVMLPPVADPIQDAIARNVAGLVPDTATVQLGMGRIADTLADILAARRRIGLHSGTLPRGALAPIREGAFRGPGKSVDQGLQVATGLAINAGPGPWGNTIRLRPISETHDPVLLAKHARLWAINSAFQIDLFGQVNAEWMHGARLASGGGQTDFLRAAHQSPGGAAVLALPSRSSRGEPRITAQLSAPGVVTTTGNDLDFVVTEYGVADLRGISLHTRRERIASVAHPDDRSALLASGDAT